MKRFSLAAVALAVVIIAVAGMPAPAFHDGGVAHCNGCHTMHNSQNGAAMNGTALDANGDPVGGLPVGEGYPDLLLFPNRTDVCLRCHAGNNSYHVWADDVLNPGQEHGAGNFVFLEEDNLNDGHRGGSGTCDTPCDIDTDGITPIECDTEADCLGVAGTWTWSNPIPGQSSGHTLASGIKGTGADTYLGAAPGGTYPNVDLTCDSCHDPHGNDSFRLTYVSGQQATSVNGVTVTYAGTIDAAGMGLFGPTANEANNKHNAYKSGYSEWCSSCHTDFHNNYGNLIHPSGTNLTTDTVASYNKYDGTSDCIANPPVGTAPCGTGVQATAYLAMVPFEDAGATTTSTLGPSTASKVACVTCHRAHASSAADAGRWDFDVTGLAEDGHESGSYALPNPYDEFQRSLCNKCHSQDEYDELVDFTP